MEVSLQEHGLWGVFVGCLLEGEAALLATAYAIQQNWLTYGPAFSIALAATLFFDWSVFLIGRYGAAGLFRRFPKLQDRRGRALQLLERHSSWLLFAYRFMYGLRTMLLLGMSSCRISLFRFLICSLLGAGAWVLVYLSLGHQLARLITYLLPGLRLSTGLLLGFSGLIIFLFIKYLRKRSRMRRQAQ